MKKELEKLLACMVADKILNDDIEVAIEEGFDILVSNDGDVLIVNNPHKNHNRKERRGRKYRQRMADIKKHRLGTSRKYARNQVDAYWVDDEKVTHWVGDPEECNGLPYDEFQKYWNDIPWDSVKGTKVRDSGYTTYEKGRTAWSRKTRHDGKKQCFEYEEEVGQVTVENGVEDVEDVEYTPDTSVVKMKDVAPNVFSNFRKEQIKELNKRIEEINKEIEEIDRKIKETEEKYKASCDNLLKEIIEIIFKEVR